MRWWVPTAAQRMWPAQRLMSGPFPVSWLHTMSLTYFPLPKIAEKQALGKKLFGPTAESEQKKAETIAPLASHAPITVGRRSKRADGSLSFSISHRTALTREPDQLIF